MGDSLTVRDIVESWFRQRGIADPAPFDDWIASMALQSLAPDEYLVRAGEGGRYLYFIHTGLLRLYYLSPEGRERNKAFFGPGQVTGAVSAAISGGPAPFTIQALEQSLLVRADFDTLYRQAWRQPELARAVIELLSEAFIRNEQREAVLLTCNAEQRYRWLLEHEPELLQRLPQFHIASYLGIDAVSLSRLKRKLQD